MHCLYQVFLIQLIIHGFSLGGNRLYADSDYTFFHGISVSGSI